MSDTTTFFTQISCFFWAFWAFVLRMLSSKHRSTTHPDDLEAGIPSDSVNRRIPGTSNTASPVVSGFCTTDKFVDINLNSDSKIKETKAISIPTHVLPMKPSVIDTDHSRQFQPPAKHDKAVSVSFPVIPTYAQIHAVDNRSKHRGIQFSSSAVLSLPKNHSKSKSRKHSDSISDLLDQFPTPPEHIPPRLPVVNRDIVQQVLEKTSVAPAENCPSPTISEESTTSSNFGSNSILSTNSSTSISNDTANTSVPDMPQCVTCTSAISKVPSSGIDVKEKNIARLTLVHDPETFVFPATNARCLTRSQSLFTNKPKALRKTYHDVVGSPRKADLQKGDIPKERPFVAPLRIIKKNKIQPTVVPLALPVARRVESGNWEQAMDNVLQAFREAEMEDQDFRDLFYGDSSFVSQSSVVNTSGDDGGNLDGHGEYDGDCEKRLKASFESIENSVDENLSMLIAPPDVVTLKVEDLASVSLSSGGAIAERIMEVKVNNQLDLPLLRLCDSEGYEDSYSWTAATDDDDDSHSEWSDRLELDDYVS